jgi:hypothetical protein
MESGLVWAAGGCSLAGGRLGSCPRRAPRESRLAAAELLVTPVRIATAEDVATRLDRGLENHADPRRSTEPYGAHRESTGPAGRVGGSAGARLPRTDAGRWTGCDERVERVALPRDGSLGRISPAWSPSPTSPDRSAAHSRVDSAGLLSLGV